MVNRVPQQLRPLVVFMVYSILTIIMMWPVVTRLGSDIPGGDGDAWEHLWIFSWVRDSLLAGHSPFYTDLIFYPHGVSLSNQNIAWFNIALWLPLQVTLEKRCRLHRRSLQQWLYLDGESSLNLPLEMSHN